MKFVGMYDDDLPRQRRPRLTSIPERLYTTQSQADRIRIMPVKVETVAGKPCLDPLDPLFGRREMNSVGLNFAQTFKTRVLIAS